MGADHIGDAILEDQSRNRKCGNLDQYFVFLFTSRSLYLPITSKDSEKVTGRKSLGNKEINYDTIYYFSKDSLV